MAPHGRLTLIGATARRARVAYISMLTALERLADTGILGKIYRP